MTKTLKLMFLYQTWKEKALGVLLRTHTEEKNKFNLDLKVYKVDHFDINVPFQKIKDVLINGFQYYDTNTQK